MHDEQAIILQVGEALALADMGSRAGYDMLRMLCQQMGNDDYRIPLPLLVKVGQTVVTYYQEKLAANESSHAVRTELQADGTINVIDDWGML